MPRKSSLSQMITQQSSPSGLYSTSMHLNKCYESRTAFHLHTLKDSSKRDLRKGSLWASLVLMITFCYTNDLRYFFFWKKIQNVFYLLSQVKNALQRNSFRSISSAWTLVTLMVKVKSDWYLWNCNIKALEKSLK